MFVRLLFLLLLALNLGAGAWLLFGSPPAPPLPPATDPGVPGLRLWSEANASNHTSAGASGPLPMRTPDTSATVACTTLGPFTTSADMRTVMGALSPHVDRIQYREEEVQRSHGYWVYLPALANREAALDEARRLAGKDIHDYYVVTAGDNQNMISLGLFNDESNAKRRLARVTQLGFAARIKQRVDTAPVYWIDYAVSAGDAFDLAAWLPDRDDLQVRPIDCF